MARYAITPHEIGVVLNAHHAVGNSSVRIVEFIKRNVVLPTDPLYAIYHGRDTKKAAKRVAMILKKQNAG